MFGSRWIVIEPDGEDRNPHGAYSCFVMATALGVLAVVLCIAAIVLVFV
jgi:hypothetical protein